jgi:hypothetical protein
MTKGKWTLNTNKTQVLNEKGQTICSISPYAATSAEERDANAIAIESVPHLISELQKIIMMDEKSLLSDLAYQGPDIPKKYRDETLARYEGYNKCLSEIKKLAKQALLKAGVEVGR